MSGWPADRPQPTDEQTRPLMAVTCAGGKLGLLQADGVTDVPSVYLSIDCMRPGVEQFIQNGLDSSSDEPPDPEERFDFWMPVEIADLVMQQLTRAIKSARGNRS